MADGMPATFPACQDPRFEAMEKISVQGPVNAALWFCFFSLGLEIEKLSPYQPRMLELHYRYLREQTFISVDLLIRLPPHTHSDWVPSG